MAFLKVVTKGGVLITDTGDRLVDENGNGFTIAIESIVLKKNGKILVATSGNNR